MNLLNLKLVTPPIAEPVTLPQAKQQLRVYDDEDDALIAGLIIAARQYAERYTELRFYNQTWQRTLDYFPIFTGSGSVNVNNRKDWMYYGQYWQEVMIQLPGKVNSITSISFTNNCNTVVTLSSSDYLVDLSSIPCRIVPAQGMTWPVEEIYAPGSVNITYVAGSYGDGVEVNTCPHTIILAILMLVDHWYKNRSLTSEKPLTTIPLGVAALLDCERMESAGIA